MTVKSIPVFVADDERVFDTHEQCTVYEKKDDIFNFVNSWFIEQNTDYSVYSATFVDSNLEFVLCVVDSGRYEPYEDFDVDFDAWDALAKSVLNKFGAKVMTRSSYWGK